MKQTNTLISALYLLGIKHTDMYANLLFNEHPNKYNMLGLSEMFSMKIRELISIADLIISTSSNR